MENREKLENPIIEFTRVTLMNTGASSSCEEPNFIGQDGPSPILDVKCTNGVEEEWGH